MKVVLVNIDEIFYCVAVGAVKNFCVFCTAKYNLYLLSTLRVVLHETHHS